MSSDDNVLSIRAISEIEQNGFDGGMADLPKSSNPHPEGSWQSAAWEYGRPSGRKVSRQSAKSMPAAP